MRWWRFLGWKASDRLGWACVLVAGGCLAFGTWPAVSLVAGDELAGEEAAGDEATGRAPATDRMVDYRRDVQPLLARRCLECHGPAKRESNFRVDRRAVLLAGGDLGQPAIKPGAGKDSYLIRVVAGLEEDLVMPPEGPRLTAEEIGILRAWIDQGAEFGVPAGEPAGAGADADDRLTTRHWSFQPIASPEVPPANGDWARNAVDAFVLRRLEQAGLQPAPEADRRTLVRRLYLDLWGLPADPEAIDRFVEDDRPDAYERLVDRLLASPRYGERWARHWLDVARFAETNGFETNTPRPNAYHYRDYVIRSLNQDLRYDQFVREQLAGDSLGSDAATSFLVGGAYDTVKSPDINLTLMQRQDELADMINTTGTTFMGLTLGCARCHNHKFDPILQRDYYAMQAVFAGVQHGDRPLRELDADRQQQTEALQRRIEAVETQFAPFAASAMVAPAVTSPATSPSTSPAAPTAPPPGRTRRLIVIDDEDVGRTPGVRLLADKTGHGTNPGGSQRGQRDDPGDIRRLPNLSQGRYTWWQAEADQDLVAYYPAAEGRYRVWLSWGCGWPTHAEDACFLLDLDGDVSTTDDQRSLAVVDQRTFADGSTPPDQQALWSGLRDVGVHTLKTDSCILLRSGSLQRAVTADLLVLEEVSTDEAVDRPGLPSSSRLPWLRPPVNARENVERFPDVSARFVRFSVQATNSSEPCLDELQIFASDQAGESAKLEDGDNVGLAERGAVATSSGDYPDNPKHRLEHVNDGRLGNSFSWISNQAGQGWVQIELPEPRRINRIVWGRDREQQYADRLATRYVIEVAEQPGAWRVVASSNDRLPMGSVDPPAYRFAHLPLDQRQQAAQLWTELSDLRRQLESFTTTRDMVYGGNFVTPPPTYRLHRGDPSQPRERVAPDALTVLGSLELKLDEPEANRRLTLAGWITSAEHPLTARVIVNRVWQHHFGAGLVPTSSDFGANGAEPSHPELLDWLATELVRREWSLKALHRLLVLSATYRQSSLPRSDALAVDAQCRLLWRFPARRLEAEAIRDSVLQVCGTLDLRMYGPGYSTFEPNSNYVRNYEPLRQWGPAQWRRMVYMTKVRMEQDAIFGSFDCPDAGQSAPNRSRSTTAIQALNLLNSPFMVQQAERLVERLQAEAGSDRPRQIELAFRLTTGQAPDASQQPLVNQLVEQHGLLPLCIALLNSNEFLFIP